MSSRRVVLTHRVVPSLASRRVVTSRRAHPSRRAVSRIASRRLPSRVSWSVVPSSLRRVVAASPHLSCRCRLLRYYIVVLSSSPIAPLLLVGCCVCPLSRSPSQSLALRRVLSPHAWHHCRLASPVALLRCIVLTCRVVAVASSTSRVSSCRRRRVASSPPRLTCPSLSS